MLKQFVVYVAKFCIKFVHDSISARVGLVCCFEGVENVCYISENVFLHSKLIPVAELHP